MKKCLKKNSSDLLYGPTQLDEKMLKNRPTKIYFVDHTVDITSTITNK